MPTKHNKRIGKVVKLKAWAIIHKGRFNVNNIFLTKKLAKLNTIKNVMGFGEIEPIIPCEITYKI